MTHHLAGRGRQVDSNTTRIFPLKAVFRCGTRSEDGEDVAWDTIRIKLNDLIEKEDKQKPYSDDDLVRELAKLGLTVARARSPSIVRRWASRAVVSARTGPRFLKDRTITLMILSCMMTQASMMMRTNSKLFA